MKKLFFGLLSLTVLFTACGKKDDTIPDEEKETAPLVKSITNKFGTETFEYDANNKLVKSEIKKNGSNTADRKSYFTYTNGLLTQVSDTNSSINKRVYGMAYNGSTLAKIFYYDLIMDNPDNKTDEPSNVDSITYYPDNKIKACYTLSGWSHGIITIDSVVWNSKGNVEKSFFYINMDNKIQLASTNTYTYDDKKNPFATNLGLLLQFEASFDIYQLSGNNPLTISTTVASPFSGTYAQTFTYEYSALGYPVKITSIQKTDENTDTRDFTLVYSK